MKKVILNIIIMKANTINSGDRGYLVQFISGALMKKTILQFTLEN